MKQKSLKLNFLMNILLTMSSFIFPLITFPYVSRVLGPAGTGKVSFATSVISYFSLFAQLGIPTYGIRVCAGIRDNKEELTRTVHELLFISLITTLISYLALFIALFTIPKLRAEKPLLVVISASILLSAIGIEWLYKALEQYTYITVRSVIFKFIALVGMFFLVRSEKDYVAYGFITIFAASASNVLNLINAHRYIGFRPVGRYNLKRHLKPVFVFFAMSCASTIYTNLDVVMLGFMKNETEVGYYNTAVKVKAILGSVLFSLANVTLPRASYYIREGLTQEFRRISKKALTAAVLLSIPLTVYFTIFAKDSVLLLSGDAFLPSVLPMQIIMPTVFLIGITNLLGFQILVPTDREKIVLYSVIAGAATDLVINALLIPRLASAGAAIGTLVAETVVLIIQCVYLRKETGSIFREIRWLKILGGTAAAVLLSFFVLWLPVGPFLTVLISAVLFFGVYGVFLLLTKEELVTELWKQGLSFLKRK